MRPHLPLLFSLSLIAAAAPSHAAQSALGAEGEVYRIRTVYVADVDPSATAARGTNAALVFETQRADAALDRELVPGTDDADVETNPTLVLEEKSGAVFVLWQTRVGNAFPVLNLASRTPAGWSEAIEISGNPYAFKSTPQLLVTRDTSRSPDNTLQHRTIIHVAWAEEDAAGLYDSFYTPLILENGTYIGHNVVYRVAAFDRAVVSANAISPGLLKAPRLQPGSDGNTVHLIFAAGDQGRIDTLEIRVLPRSLVALGDGARAHIIGADTLNPKTLNALAEASRAFVLDANLDMRPAIARALGDEVRDFVLGWKPAKGGPVALADGARAHIIGVGSEFGGALRNITAEAPSVIEEIAARGGAAHAFRFILRARRPAPPMSEATAYALFASGDGSEATVAWASGSRIAYCESSGAAWGAIHELQLDSSFDLEDALGMLAERTASR